MISSFKNPSEEKIIQEIYQNERQYRVDRAVELTEKYYREISEARKKNIPFEERQILYFKIQMARRSIEKVKKMPLVFNTGKLTKEDWEFIKENSMDYYFRLIL